MKFCIVGPGIQPIPPTGWGAVEILIDDIRKSLRYYAKSNNGNSNFKRFFISGGFAELNGLKELIKDELRIETEILNPLNNIACDMKIDNPSKYSVSIGLALRGLI